MSGRGFLGSTPARLTATFSLAQMLSLGGIGVVPGLLPALIDLWDLTGSQGGWLTGAYFLGYMVSVPVLASITDRIDARGVFVASTLLSALAVLGFAAFAQGFWSAVFIQVLSGMGLAGTYMPGLKALTDRLPEQAAPRAVGFFTAISSIGSAFSIFAVGWLEPVFGWRLGVAVMAVFPLAALLLVFAAAGPQAPVTVERRSALLDFRPVFANRRALAYVFAYGAHAWELFALRSWIVAYLVFSQSLQATGTLMADWPATAVAAVLVMLGLPASVLGNEASGRFGRRRVVIVIMMASALMACVMGFLAVLPFPLLLAFMVVYSCLVAGESASVTAGVLTNAAPGQRGATLAVHSFIGFAGASAGPVVFGLLLSLGGGIEAPLAWGLGFAGGGLAVALGGLLVWRIGPR